MKQSDIEIGGTYLTLVSGQEVRVRVTGVAPERYVPSGMTRRAQQYTVENLKTGNRLKRTAAALRRRALDFTATAKLAASLGSHQEFLGGMRFQVRFPLVAMPARDELYRQLRAARVPCTCTVGKVDTSAAGTCSVVFEIRD